MLERGCIPTKSSSHIPQPYTRSSFEVEKEGSSSAHSAHILGAYLVAVMDSSAWAVTDHAMHPAAEDEFQQFLDMSNMSNMGDGINYEIHEFHHSAGNQQMDAPMSGTDAPMLLSRVDPALQQQMPSITTTSAYQTIPTTMMPRTTMIPPPTQTEAIVDSIDAQIQFLQRQKLEHQQRQLDEQRAAFFAYQQNHMVPPTPQSLEIQAANNHFYPHPSPAERHDQQQRQQAVEYRYPRLKDRQDVRANPPFRHTRSLLTYL